MGRRAAQGRPLTQQSGRLRVDGFNVGYWTQSGLLLATDPERL